MKKFDFERKEGTWIPKQLSENHSGSFGECETNTSRRHTENGHFASVMSLKVSDEVVSKSSRSVTINSDVVNIQLIERMTQPIEDVLMVCKHKKLLSTL
jgi:hypothetical protein